MQLWVPDVRSAAFSAEARRQSALVASTATDSDDLAFVEAISATWGE